MKFLQGIALVIGLLGLILIVGAGASLIFPGNILFANIKGLGLLPMFMISVALNLSLMVDNKKLRDQK